MADMLPKLRTSGFATCVGWSYTGSLTEGVGVAVVRPPVGVQEPKSLRCSTRLGSPFFQSPCDRAFFTGRDAADKDPNAATRLG